MDEIFRDITRVCFRVKKIIKSKIELNLVSYKVFDIQKKVMIIGHDLEVYGEKIKEYFAKFGIVDLHPKFR
jgi:hypothetical protein